MPTTVGHQPLTSGASMPHIHANNCWPTYVDRPGVSDQTGADMTSQRTCQPAPRSRSSVPDRPGSPSPSPSRRRDRVRHRGPACRGRQHFSGGRGARPHPGGAGRTRRRRRADRPRDAARPGSPFGTAPGALLTVPFERIADTLPVHADGPAVRDRGRAAGPAAGTGRRRAPPLPGDAVVQDPDGVTLTMSTGETLRAGYAVGADGMHSAVREASGIGFTGSAYARILRAGRRHHGLGRAGTRCP